MKDIVDIAQVTRTVETARAGQWTFKVGVASEHLALPLIRVEDAHRRFTSSPLSQVASELEKEVLVSSVWGTNTIEGGDVSEEETAAIMELDPNTITEQARKRVANLKEAYDFAALDSQKLNWRPTADFVIEIHRRVTRGLAHPHNTPGALRDTPKNMRTHVGDADHGGVYKPPQYGGDVQLLLAEMFLWDGEMIDAGVPALVRAPLLHLYFEQIHPFWDGNGRVGRVLELAVLRAVNYRYVPFALPKFYLANIDHYFTLFNRCRKDRSAYSNTAFVTFFLEGMLESTNRLHDRVNALVSHILFLAVLKQMRDSKALNDRQYAVMNMLCNRDYKTYEALRADPVYRHLYAKVTAKTRQRDWRNLVELNLVRELDDGRIQLND